MTRSVARRLWILLIVGLVMACAESGAPTASPSAIPGSAVTSTAPGPTGVPTPDSTPALDLEARLDRLFAINFNGSALVAKDGVVAYAKGIGMADDASNLANTPETRFRIGSITKQFTAMAILLLESRGRIGASDSICDYVDPCPEGWSEVSIEHLIAHTSRIAEFTEQPDFDDRKATTPAETVAAVADIPLGGAPGATFRYSNTGYVLLGMVIEAASGMSYEQFLEDEIFGPLGMTDSGYEHEDTPGLATGYVDGFTLAAPLDMSVPYAAGGLYSTVLDLARWDEALYTDALAPAADMARYVEPLVMITDSVGFGYAYGLYVGDIYGSKLVWHDGGINGFYTQLSKYVDDHVTVALLTNRERSPDLRALAQAAASEARETP